MQGATLLAGDLFLGKGRDTARFWLGGLRGWPQLPCSLKSRGTVELMLPQGEFTAPVSPALVLLLRYRG